MKVINKKRVTLKILAALAAVVLIGLVLSVANSLMGNPISAAMADKAISRYIQKNFSFLDLEVEKASYNFKYGEYTVDVKSKTSKDTNFTISYSDGKVKYDDYESRVLGKFNTIQRLSDEYSALAKSILSTELGYRDNNTHIAYDKEADIRDSDLLKLDMAFDKKLKFDTAVTISVKLTDAKMETVSKFLTDAHRAFVKNECIFKKYSLFADIDNTAITVSEITPNHIENGELTILLEEAKNNKGTGSINVYVKSAEK